METGKPSRRSLRIQLTPQQKETLREMGLGGDNNWIELTAEELEERIAPGVRLQN